MKRFPPSLVPTTPLLLIGWIHILSIISGNNNNLKIIQANGDYLIILFILTAFYTVYFVYVKGVLNKYVYFILETIIFLCASFISILLVAVCTYLF